MKKAKSITNRSSHQIKTALYSHPDFNPFVQINYSLDDLYLMIDSQNSSITYAQLLNFVMANLATSVFMKFDRMSGQQFGPYIDIPFKTRHTFIRKYLKENSGQRVIQTGHFSMVARTIRDVAEKTGGIFKEACFIEVQKKLLKVYTRRIILTKEKTKKTFKQLFVYSGNASKYIQRGFITVGVLQQCMAQGLIKTQADDDFFVNDVMMPFYENGSIVSLSTFNLNVRNLKKWNIIKVTDNMIKSLYIPEAEEKALVPITHLQKIVSSPAKNTTPVVINNAFKFFKNEKTGNPNTVVSFDCYMKDVVTQKISKVTDFESFSPISKENVKDIVIGKRLVALEEKYKQERLALEQEIDALL